MKIDVEWRIGARVENDQRKSKQRNLKYELMNRDMRRHYLVRIHTHLGCVCGRHDAMRFDRHRHDQKLLEEVFIFVSREQDDASLLCERTLRIWCIVWSNKLLGLSCTRTTVAMCRRPSSLLTSFKYLMRFGIYAATRWVLALDARNECSENEFHVGVVCTGLLLLIGIDDLYTHFLSMASQTLKVTADDIHFETFHSCRWIYWESFGNSSFPCGRWDLGNRFLEGSDFRAS